MSTLFLYLVVDILAVISCGISEKMKNNIVDEKKNKIYKYSLWTFLSLIIMSALVGLRRISVGIDTYGYVQVFYRIVDNTASIIDTEWLGIGYIQLLRLIGYIFGKNYIVFNSVIGITTLVFLFKAITQNSKNYTLSLFLFISTTLFYQMLNQSRQLLAICIVLYSFKYLKEKKLIKYLIFILLAASIHESALIMLPFYFIKDFKLKKSNFFIYMVIILAAYFGFSYIERFIISTHYGSLYYGSDYYASSFSSVIVLLFRTCLMLFLLVTSNDNNKITNDNKILLNFSIFCTIVQVLTLKVHILGRVSTYFFIFYIISIPNILNSIENEKRKKIYTFFIIVLFIVYHFGYYYLNASGAGYEYYQLYFQ